MMNTKQGYLLKKFYNYLRLFLKFDEKKITIEQLESTHKNIKCE